MSLITNSDLNSVSLDAEFRKSASAWRNRDAGTLLEELASSRADQFDVFLSHSYRDAQTLGANQMLKLTVFLEKLGLTVYVDWIVDGDLDRNQVTTATAARIRKRMDQSKCLMFATSASSSSSKWMPWELGYKDGSSRRVAILPVVDQRKTRFYGQEYLGLYPFVTKRNDQYGRPRLCIETSDGRYVPIDEWLRTGKSPYKWAS